MNSKAERQRKQGAFQELRSKELSNYKARPKAKGTKQELRSKEQRNEKAKETRTKFQGN